MWPELLCLLLSINQDVSSKIIWDISCNIFVSFEFVFCCWFGLVGSVCLLGLIYFGESATGGWLAATQYPPPPLSTAAPVSWVGLSSIHALPLLIGRTSYMTDDLLTANIKMYFYLNKRTFKICSSAR